MRKLHLLFFAFCFILGACAGPASIQPSPTVTIKNTPVQVPLPATGSATATPAGSQATCSRIPLNGAILVMSDTAGSGGKGVAPIDPANGLPLCGFAFMPFSGEIVYNFSYDGKRLAIVANYISAEGVLHLVDLQSWKDTLTPVRISGNVRLITFNPAGTQVAIAVDYPPSLIIADLKAQKITAQKTLRFTPYLLRYTPDGAAIVLFGGEDFVPNGTKPKASAQLLSARDQSVVWEAPLQGIWAGQSQPKADSSDPIFDMWEPGFALTKDGSTLYIVHADEDRLTTVNFARRSVTNADIQPRLSLMDRLLRFGAGVAEAKGANGTTKQALLSPDGTRLYVLGMTEQTSVDGNGNFQVNQTPLGLQVIDPGTGTELKKLDTTAAYFYLSPDASAVILNNWQDTSSSSDVVSARSLKTLKHIDQGNIFLANTIGGQELILMQHQPDNHVTVINPQSFDPSQAKPWYMPGYSLAYLP
ncbi:MAG: hypothetical protein ACM3PY_04845 [Omnitrophica WOR_2 bacterium]